MKGRIVFQLECASNVGVQCKLWQKKVKSLVYSTADTFLVWSTNKLQEEFKSCKCHYSDVNNEYMEKVLY